MAMNRAFLLDQLREARRLVGNVAVLIDPENEREDHAEMSVTEAMMALDEAVKGLEVEKVVP